MRKKHVFLTCLTALLLTSVTLESRAQVGGLTNTGNITVCLNTTAPFGVMATSGSTYTWSILAGSGGAGTIMAGETPDNLISVTWTSAGTCTLQVIETNGTCAGNPVTIEVSVLPALIPGTASADQTICFNSIPEPIIVTAPTGGNSAYIYQWESSTDGGASWAIIPGAIGLSHSPDALTATTLFHLIQSAEGACGSLTTNAVTITVQPQVITSSIFHN